MPEEQLPHFGKGRKGSLRHSALGRWNGGTQVRGEWKGKGEHTRLGVLLGEFDEEVVAADFDAEAGDAYGGVQYGLPCGDIELPAVPGAGDLLPVEDALPKRATPVKACVINGIEGAADVGDGYCVTVQLEFLDLAGSDFAGLGSTK